MKQNFNKPQTLCWDCRNACGNGCSWSKDLEPVPGWTVEETNIGVRVTACPKFIRDGTLTGRKPEDLDTDGCIELLKAAGRVMFTDYLDGEGRYKYDRTMPETIMDTIMKNRRDTEKFLLSEYGRTLMMLTNPESIVEMLRKRAEAYDEAESGNLAEGW